MEHQKAFHYDESQMNYSLRRSDIRFRCSRRTKKMFLQKNVIKNGKGIREEMLTLVPKKMLRKKDEYSRPLTDVRTNILLVATKDLSLLVN
jgi:hypothetical protein